MINISMFARIVRSMPKLRPLNLQLQQPIPIHIGYVLLPLDLHQTDLPLHLLLLLNRLLSTQCILIPLFIITTLTINLPTHHLVPQHMHRTTRTPPLPLKQKRIPTRKHRLARLEKWWNKPERQYLFLVVFGRVPFRRLEPRMVLPDKLIKVLYRRLISKEVILILTNLYHNNSTSSISATLSFYNSFIILRSP